MSRLIRSVGPCRIELSLERSPCEALVSAVAHQQLTGRVAQVILGRFFALYPGTCFPDPQAILDTSLETLRSVGFSRAKAAAIQDIAAKTLVGVVPSSKRILSMSDDEVIDQLTQVRGVGRWTVEMLLIFTLGRPDVWPVDDYGIRKGFARAYGLKELPKPKELREFGERWRPFRSTAAWYFWRAADELTPVIPPRRRAQKEQS